MFFCYNFSFFGGGGGGGVLGFFVCFLVGFCWFLRLFRCSFTNRFCFGFPSSSSFFLSVCPFR